LRLQVHHINGDHNDNRVENIQLLCPNCHAQTDTYARHNTTKNGGFVVKNIEELKDSINYVKPKYCKKCGKEITNGSNEYCSHECAQKASRRFEVSSAQLIEDFKELKSFTAVGRKYNVSDNAIRRRVKKLGVYEEVRQFITPR
jgi:transposase